MRKLILFSALILMTQIVLGQNRYFYAALDINKPTSNTSWIGDVSARGARAGYRAFINDRFSAGLDISWSALDQYNPTETIQNPTGALTTDFFKYIYNYGVTISGQYYFKIIDNERFYPYAGLGLGANHNDYVIYYNIYQDREKAWGFLARPEAGILYKVGNRRSLGFMAGVHYDYSTNQSEKFGYNNFNTLGFQLGIVFFER
jgi:hypothetical protein